MRFLSRIGKILGAPTEHFFLYGESGSAAWENLRNWNQWSRIGLLSELNGQWKTEDAKSAIVWTPLIRLADIKS